MWPDLAKFRHFVNILKVLGDYTYEGLFSVEQKFEPALVNILWYWANFIVANGLILTKNLAIWSHCSAPHIAPFQYFVQCVPILQKSFQSQISCSSDALKLTYHCSLLNDKKWTSVPYHQSQSGDGYDVTWQRTTNGRAPNWRLWRCQASVFGSGTKIDFVGTFSACHHQRSILDQKLAKICSFKKA